MYAPPKGSLSPKPGRGRRIRPASQLAGPLIAVLILLFLFYLPTLQSQINGSSNPYAEDVAEIQTALNLFGTIHATGYPLYAMLGGAFVWLMKQFGMNPALAPSLYSTMWGFVALSLFYTLIVKLTGRTGVAAVCALLLGLTRGVWAYSVLAKPYTMTLAFCALLLLIALWPSVESRRRVLLLALAGGFAVAHHRMIAFMAPGLLIAALPPLWRDKRRVLPTLALSVPIALIGFLPYLYLPARAYAGGLYVYGNPTTLQGFWDEFTAKEANHLFRVPQTVQAWTDDAGDTLSILFEQMTVVGTAVGVFALVYRLPRRRLARTAALCGVGFLIFLLVLHRVVMPTAVMIPVVMLFMFLIAISLNDLMTAYRDTKLWPAILPMLTITSTAGLLAFNFAYLYNITHDDSSLKMIAIAREVPRDGVFMLPWSTSFNAVAFSRYVTKENADLAIVDHRGDFRAIAAQGKPIYTYRDTLYRFPVSWWESQIGRVYLSSPVESVVSLRTQPQTALFEPLKVLAGKVALQSYRLYCDDAHAHLEVNWTVSAPLQKYLSIFVHLIDSKPENVRATGDVSAPIYGWYPFSRWSQNELVVDHYTVELKRDATALQFGLYEQPQPGQFINYPALTLPLADYGCIRN